MEPLLDPPPTAVPRPFFNGDRSVVVASEDEPAFGTRMDTHGERLAHDRTTATAFLTGTAWVHLDELATGALSLACENRDELCPPGIVNVLGQHPGCQALDVEVLHLDGVEPYDEVGCGLVVEVAAHARDLGVLSAKQSHRLASSVRALVALARDAPLRSLQPLLRSTVRTWTLHLLARAERRERRDADVHADALPRAWQYLALYVATDHRRVPVTIAIERDGDLLEHTL